MMLIDDQRADLRRRDRSAGRSGRRWSRSARRANRAAGTAARAQLLGKFGPRQRQRRGTSCERFSFAGSASRESVREARVALDAPLKLGRTVCPGPCRRASHRPQATARSSSTPRRGCRPISTASISATEVRYQQAISRRRRRAPPGELSLGTDRQRPDRRRADSRPTELRRLARRAISRAPNCRLTGRRPKMPIGKARSPMTARTSWRALRITHIRRFDTHGASRSPARPRPTARSRSGFNLNFSLDPRHGFTMSRQAARRRPAWSTRLVYRDLNDNGVRDPDEPLEKGALITTGTKPGRAPDRCQRLGHDRRPHRLHSGRRRNRRRPASTTRCWCPRRRCRSSCRGPASRRTCEIGAGRRRRHRRRDRQERRAGLRRARPRAGRCERARSSRPRAPISTASSCSSACPTAITACGWRRTLGRGGAGSPPISALSVTVTRRQIGRSARRDPRRSRRRSSRPRRTPQALTLTGRVRCQHAPGMSAACDGAVEKTRTSTAFRPQRPQRCASTSSATTARHEMSRRGWAAATGKAARLAKPPKARNAALDCESGPFWDKGLRALFTIARGSALRPVAMLLARRSRSSPRRAQPPVARTGRRAMVQAQRDRSASCPAPRSSSAQANAMRLSDRRQRRRCVTAGRNAQLAAKLIEFE